MSSDRQKDDPNSSTSRILGATLGGTTLKSLIPARTTLVNLRVGATSATATWEDAVSEYRRNPSEATFNVMGARYQSETKTPLLSEVVFSVAANRNTVMFMRHLAAALFVDRRLLEANYFTDRWLALEPDSFDAIKLKVTICIDRGELRTAADNYNKMGPMRPTSIEVARLRLMLYLRADQLANAQEFARAFIELPNLTPPDVLLVAEVAIRARDPVLVRAAVFRRGRATYNQRVEPMLREVARLGLLRTLAIRAGDP